jgi:hypothetical protein
MPSTSLKTTTIAGALLRSTLRVPIPCPPPPAPHSFHVMSVTVMFPLEHPTVSSVGRTCGVDPGPQDRTAGTVAPVVVVVGGDVVVDTCAVGVEVPLAVELVVDGGDLEPTVDQIVMPTPSATRMSVTIPTQTTVLRRTVMRRGSLSTTKGNGSSGRSRRSDVLALQAAGWWRKYGGPHDGAASGLQGGGLKQIPAGTSQRRGMTIGSAASLKQALCGYPSAPL